MSEIQSVYKKIVHELEKEFRKRKVKRGEWLDKCKGVGTEVVCIEMDISLSHALNDMHKIDHLLKKICTDKYLYRIITSGTQKSMGVSIRVQVPDWQPDFLQL